MAVADQTVPAAVSQLPGNLGVVGHHHGEPLEVEPCELAMQTAFGEPLGDLAQVQPITVVVPPYAVHRPSSGAFQQLPERERSDDITAVEDGLRRLHARDGFGQLPDVVVGVAQDGEFHRGG
jgi:hypothetical protein